MAYFNEENTVEQMLINAAIDQVIKSLINN